MCQRINWQVHLKQRRCQEARNKSHLSLVSILLAKLGNSTSTVSLYLHENQACPPSISDMGRLRQGSKSDLTECLTKSSQPASIHLGIDTKALDGAAIVHGQGRSLSTFEEYSQEMILPYITSQLETVSRVDIVWDKYLTNSLKQSIVERTVALRRDNACLKERLFRRTRRLSREVMLRKINCFATCPIAHMHAKLAER